MDYATATVPRSPWGRCVTLLVAAATLGGCSNAWETNYVGQRRAPLAHDAPIHMIDTSDGNDASVTRGMVRLGQSRFQQPSECGPRSLEAFARSIGATEVRFRICRSVGPETTSTVHMNVPTRSRTTGTIDGRHVDVETTGSEWQDVPVTSRQRGYLHVGSFFAPESRLP